jgi:predicted AlkP superfamily phosphohydrolase/phosphomutase
VIVVGFDGLEPSLVRKWAGEGKLPNFKRLMYNGAFGELASVVPPSSAPAWTSAVTGVNPGKHGIYSFLVNAIPTLSSSTDKNAPGPPVFCTSANRGFQAVWDGLGRCGRRSILTDIPLTSPADSLNGIMISGFPHASEDRAADYWPPSTVKYLTDYVFDSFGIPVGRGHEQEFISDQEATSAKRLRVGLSLFDEPGWDLFWIVFTFTDRYQHYFWKYMDRNHPMYDPVAGQLYGGAIESAYVMADTYLGEFAGRMRDTDLLVVLSDHGFRPVYYVVNSTNFLVRSLGQVPEIMCADYFEVKFRIVTSGPGAEEKHASLEKALTASLRELTDPTRGTRIVDSVYVKEQIYKGPYLSMAPDVIGQEAAGYLFFTLPMTPDLRLIDAGPNPDEAFSGFHKREGTLGLYGKYIRPGQTVNARIIDIAPIIYAYLGVPAPAEIDGRVPAQAFNQDVTDRMMLIKSQDPGYRKPRNLAGQDSKKIEKQLRSVGYIQ